METNLKPTTIKLCEQLLWLTVILQLALIVVSWLTAMTVYDSAKSIAIGFLSAIIPALFAIGFAKKIRISFWCFLIFFFPATIYFVLNTAFGSSTLLHQTTFLIVCSFVQTACTTAVLFILPLKTSRNWFSSHAA